MGSRYTWISVRLKLIYNPAAGRGRVQRRIGEVEEHLRAAGAEVETYASTSPADLTREAAKSSRGGYDRVAICGGDGTLHLAIREFDLGRGTLALIPSGSGDDFARVNGIPRDLKAASEVAVRGQAREVDVATANGLRYAGVAGVGFDSEVARYANAHVKNYTYAILRVLPSFKPLRMKIDGRDEEIMFAAFGNSPQYGGGIRIAPTAVLDDGQLDACIVHRATKLQLITTLPLAYTGKHVRKSFVEMRRAPHFVVESEARLDVFADGEPLTTTPVRFAIASEKLKIVVGSDLRSSVFHQQ